MNYKLPSTGSGVSAASLSSMIDIIFLLIIFFVVTASFDKEQLDASVKLPGVNSGIAVKSLPPDRLVINILQDGSVKLGFHHIKTNEIHTKLTSVLKSMVKNNQTTLIVNGDRKTLHKYISQVMEVVAASGFNNVRINAMIKSNEIEVLSNES